MRLNKKQKKAITYLKAEGRIDRRTYCDICGVEKTAAHEELADMVNKELIEMVGRGRGGLLYQSAVGSQQSAVSVGREGENLLYDADETDN